MAVSKVLVVDFEVLLLVSMTVSNAVVVPPFLPVFAVTHWPKDQGEVTRMMTGIRGE